MRAEPERLRAAAPPPSPDDSHLLRQAIRGLKPKTEMPNLELKETEIDALAAFLLQSR